MKKALRKALLEKRDSLTFERVDENSSMVGTLVGEFFDHWAQKKEKIDIGLYYPIRNEVDCIKIGMELHKKYSKIFNFEYCFPVITNLETCQMRYVSVDINEMNQAFFKRGKLGYEPKFYDDIPENVKVPSVVFVPLVGFDVNLNRIGFGKGFFDRYFQSNDCLKIGLAYEIQKLENIDSLFTTNDPHNIQLDVIVTEKNIYNKTSMKDPNLQVCRGN